MSHHFNPGISTVKKWRMKGCQAKPQLLKFFLSLPTLSFLLFLNMHKIPAVLHFTPNFTFNFLMNSYSASFSLCSQTSCIHFFIYQPVHEVSHE